MATWSVRDSATGFLVLDVCIRFDILIVHVTAPRVCVVANVCPGIYTKGREEQESGKGRKWKGRTRIMSPVCCEGLELQRQANSSSTGWMKTDVGKAED